MVRISAKLKIVVQFRKTGTNITNIRNFITNNILPDMRTAFQNRLGTDIANLVRHERLFVTSPANNRYEVYPKAIVEFDTNLTAQELRDRQDLIIQDWKTIIKNALDTQGATQYSWHYHLSAGGVSE